MYFWPSWLYNHVEQSLIIIIVQKCQHKLKTEQDMAIPPNHPKTYIAQTWKAGLKWMLETTHFSYFYCQQMLQLFRSSMSYFWDGFSVFKTATWESVATLLTWHHRPKLLCGNTCLGWLLLTDTSIYKNLKDRSQGSWWHCNNHAIRWSDEEMRVCAQGCILLQGTQVWAELVTIKKCIYWNYFYTFNSID